MGNSLKDTWLLVKANFIDTYNLNNIKKLLDLDSANLIKLLAIVITIFILLPMSYKFYEVIAHAIYITHGAEGLHMVIYLSIAIVTLSTVIMCLSKGISFLFSFKDFNMLSSFPINSISILGSRIVLLYISNLLVTIVVGFPAILVYGSFINANITYYLYTIPLFFTFSTIPLIVGTMISFVITKLSTNFINTGLFMSIAVIMSMFISYNFTNAFMYILLEQSLYPLETLVDYMQYYLPSNLYVNAIITQNFALFLVCIILNTLLMVLFTYLFAGNFKRLNGILTETHKKSDYKLKTLPVSSQIGALYKKELKTFFRTHEYLVSTSAGMILLTMYTVYFIIIRSQVMTWDISVIVAYLSVAITCTTRVAFSIEGKSFYILKVLPLKFSNIVLSKVLLNLTVTLPLIAINSVIMAIAFNVNIIEFILFFVSLVITSLIVSLNGIVIDLLFPKLNFKSYAEILRQSASSIITLFTNIIIFSFIIFLNFIFPNIFVIVIMLLISFMYCIYIIKKGEQLFDQM